MITGSIPGGTTISPCKSKICKGFDFLKVLVGKDYLSFVFSIENPIWGHSNIPF